MRQHETESTIISIISDVVVYTMLRLYRPWRVMLFWTFVEDVKAWWNHTTADLLPARVGPCGEALVEPSASQR